MHDSMQLVFSFLPISIPPLNSLPAAHESRAIVTIGLIPTEWLTVGT